MVSRTIGVGVVVIILIALVGVYYYLTLPSNALFVTLTDPANVPAGTQMLNITYSSLMVHTTNGSGWISVSSGGTINLLSLLNVSVLLGSLHVAVGTQVNLLRFNISSASIKYNNTVYPVTVPSGEITVPILGRNTVSGTENLLAQLMPTVHTVFTHNSTLFVLVPAARAVLISSSNISSRAVGSRDTLTENETRELEDVSPNITISTASLSSLNNVSRVSVTVKDNSNQSAQINSIVIFGGQTVYAIGIGTISRNGSDLGIRTNLTLNASERETESQGAELEAMSAVTFLVNQNGSLSLPAITSEFESAGYTLAAEQSFTFTFNSKILLGENNVLADFTSGSSYRLVVQGEDGVRASLNVTAS